MMLQIEDARATNIKIKRVKYMIKERDQVKGFENET